MNTIPISTPVETSIRLYGMRWWAMNVSAPTAAISTAAMATPSSTVALP